MPFPSPSLPLGPDPTSSEDGSVLCLALVNTVFWRRSDEPIDALTDYGRLVEAMGSSVDAKERKALLRAAAADPSGATAAWRRAVELREVLHAVFAAVADHRRPAPAALAHLDAAVSTASAGLHLISRPSYRLGWTEPAALDRPSWQVALSAAALLTGGPLDRVRACPGERCGWLFADSTRNGSRRWCDPAQCGNRERVRAHYRRTHGPA